MSLRKTVILADASARVPYPGVPGQFVGTEAFEVSIIDPFWAALVADKTLIEPPPADPALIEPPADPEPEKSPGKSKA